MKGTRSSRTLLAAVMLLSCRSGDSREHGDAHVANAPAMVLQEELRVGSVDDPDAGFSRISGLTVDNDGSVYVLEGQDRQVRVYDEQGRPLRRIGRDGEGPGEFRSPVLIGIRGDTLAVGDLNLGRITLFRRSGELLGTVHAPPIWLEPAPGLHMMVAPSRFSGDGFGSTVFRTMAAAEMPRDSFELPAVRLDREGRVADTLRLERWTLYRPTARIGSVTVGVPSGPPAGPLYIDGPEHMYVVHSPVADAAGEARFTVIRMTTAGDTVYSRDIAYTPLPFSAAVVDSIVARAVRPHLRNPAADSGAIDATIRRAMSLPAYVPPVVEGRVDADDVLWLRLSDDGSDQHRWVLLDPEGRLKAALSLPRAAVIHWSGGDRAWAVVRDEFDVPWLVRYRTFPRS